jgi:hypothetical protein
LGKTEQAGAALARSKELRSSRQQADAQKVIAGNLRDDEIFEIGQDW